MMRTSGKNRSIRSMETRRIGREGCDGGVGAGSRAGPSTGAGDAPGEESEAQEARRAPIAAADRRLWNLKYPVLMKAPPHPVEPGESGGVMEGPRGRAIL